MKLVEKRNKNFKQIFFGAGAFVAILSFTAFAANLFSPIILTHADSSSSTTDVIVVAEPFMSISYSSSCQGYNYSGCIFTPSSSGATGSYAEEFSIQTNIRAGYEVYFSSTDDNVNLVNVEKPSYYAVPVSGQTKLEELQNNTWGYSMSFKSDRAGLYKDFKMSESSEGFYPIPPISNPKRVYTIENLGDASNSASAYNDGKDKITTTYAARMDNSLPSGTYRRGVIYTVVPHDVIGGETRTLFDISTLQDMTIDICKNTTRPYENALTYTSSYTKDRNYIPKKKLVDTRDNKEYDVVRYADGSCWMAQELDLELSPSMTLTSADTNMKNGKTWTPKNATTTALTSWGDPKGDTLNTDYSVRVTTDGKTAVLYNFSAATAGAVGKTNDKIEEEGDYGSKTSTIDQDICPKGWQMFGISSEYDIFLRDYYNSGNDLSDVEALLRNSSNTSSSGSPYYYGGIYNSLLSSFFDAPLSFVKHGYIVNNGADQAVERDYNGTRAMYWTRSSGYCSSSYDSSTDSSYCKSSLAYVDQSSGKYFTSYSENRNTGAAIRCIVKRENPQIYDNLAQ